jgi:O-antigen/teichoic acid export membrane protein
MIARKSLLIISGNLLDGLLAYVALFFISREMGPEAYGIVGFAMGFVGLFTILTDLGFNSAHIKRVSEGKDIGSCLGTYLSSKLGLVLLTVSVVVGAVFIWKGVLGRGFESPDHELAIYIILGYYIVNSIGTFFYYTYIAKKEIAKAQIPIIIGTIVRTSAIIFVALSGLGPLALAWTYVLGEVIFLSVSALFFRGHHIKKPTKNCFSNYFVFARPLIVLGLSYTFIVNADKVLIQLFWDSAEVGYYFASYRIVQFLLVASSAVGILLFPTISTYHSNKDIDSIKKTVLLSERYISMLILPMVFGMVVLAEPIVNILLSSSFSPAASIFMILPLFVIFEGLSQPYMYEVIGMNRPELARNRLLIIMCSSLFFSIILIPKDISSINLDLFGLGAVGASIAIVIGYAAGYIYCRYAAWKIAKNQLNPRILIHLFAAFIMSVCLYELLIILPVQRWYVLLGYAFIGLGIYLFILFLFKEFTRKDFNFFLDILSIKKMLKYIKSELKEEKIIEKK